MNAAGVAYFDSAAIVKLVLDEPGSVSLRAWAMDRPWVTSLVAVTEVMRATRRGEPSKLPKAVEVMEQATHLPLGSDVVALAGMLDPPALRSLDAVHLASALALEDTLDAFVTYDRRLADAATAAGLHVVAPS